MPCEHRHRRIAAGYQQPVGGFPFRAKHLHTGLARIRPSPAYVHHHRVRDRQMPRHRRRVDSHDALVHLAELYRQARLHRLAARQHFHVLGYYRRRRSVIQRKQLFHPNLERLREAQRNCCIWNKGPGFNGVNGLAGNAACFCQFRGSEASRLPNLR